MTVGPVAHGGHCVARLPEGPDAGRVVFDGVPGDAVPHYTKLMDER